MSETRALLLTDVVDSTQLSQALGDAAMAELWAAHDRAARDLLAGCRGREIDKTDGMLLLFEAAADALGYALAYHRALAALPVPLKARAGLHVGPVILRENSAADVARGAKPLEVDGLSKPTAARVMSLAQGGQTFLTAEARASLGDTARQVSSHGHWVLKGVADPVELFEVCEDDAPFVAPPDGDKAYRVVRIDGRWLPVRQIPNNLPQPLTSFIGREREIGEIEQLLGRTRLLTLTGSGGCGKTRLALQVAAELLAMFPDGVWVVELAALADPGLVPQTVATVLGLKQEPDNDLTQTLAEHLGSRQALLVLDNAEHLLGACAQLADALLRHCVRVVLLVSSREGLGMAGELIYRVPSLSLPDTRQGATPEAVATCEAGRLFVERARLHSPQFAVTRQNAAALASICQRLDGIPLAIELAAARVRALSVDEVNARLDQRFRLLTGGSRNALPRQQTLRALIDWSHDLLSATEQALLRRLSVFAGGWTLASAERVCVGEGLAAEQVLDLLTALVDKSLVFAEDRGGATRYRLLETVRQYARDRLFERGEGIQWRDRHLACFLAVAEQAEPQLVGADQRAWLDRLEADHDNLRSSLAWSSAEGGNASSGLRLAGALRLFWSIRGYLGEGRGWLADCLAAAPGEAPAIRAKALCGAGVLAREQGDYAAAHSLLSEGLEIHRALGNRQGIAATLNSLGGMVHEQGDYQRARAMHEESLAIQRQMGDRQGTSSSLNSLGVLARELGDYANARSFYEEGLAIDREIGDQHSIAVSLNNLGGMATDLGDYAAARALHQESLAIRRELGDRRGIASSLTNLGDVLERLGDHATARSLLEEGLAIRRELGDRRGIATSLCALGTAANSRGDHSIAQALHEDSLALRRELGDRWGIATSLNYLGSLACERGDHPTAQALYDESLAIERALGDRWGIAESMDGLAGVALALERPARAACIWGATQRLREEIGAPLPPMELAAHDRQVAIARDALADDVAFERAWQQGRAMTLEQAIDEAMRRWP